MSFLDRAREKVKPADPRIIPPDVQERMSRGRKKMREDFYKRELCKLFLKGESYHFLNDKGAMRFQETNQGVGSGRPSHRVRNKYNMIRPMVDAKVSSSTTRVPGYEINPSSTDPEDDSAARLSSKLARQGYGKWYLRQARVKGVTMAVGEGGKAYAMPYFDPMVGPFRLVESDDGAAPELVGEGEIKVLLCDGNECYGEPGVEFYHSRWYVIEHSRPISEVEQWPGFYGGALVADARDGATEGDEPSEGKTLVTMYFERPCPRYPQGRWLTMVGGKQVIPERTYPMRQQGRVLDEPCIHQLSYRLDPDDDGLGLTWDLIDFQRTYQDAMCRSIEIKNHALVPQLLAPRGSNPKVTDAAGDIIYYDGSVPPQWRPAPDPGILGQLQNIVDRCLNDMRFVASDTDVQAAPNVATGSINAVIQQAANRWSQFIAEIAEWDSKVMRHCLLLCQEFYTEDRVLKVRGRFGWEPQATFRGADIMGQVDVTVNPASIETHSRAAMLQTLAWVQSNFPGFVRPEVAVGVALHGGAIEEVLLDWESDKARANEIIQSVMDGSIMSWPTRTDINPQTGEPLIEPVVDEATGQPVMELGPDGVTPVPKMQLQQIPGWMPRRFDNAEVQVYVLSQWLKTADASRLPEQMLEAAMMIFDAFQMLLNTQAAQAMEAQAAMAEEAGATNAAKAPTAKPMPSTPAPVRSDQPQ